MLDTEKLTEMVVELKSLECNNERTPANSRKIALLEIEILSYLKGNI